VGNKSAKDTTTVKILEDLGKSLGGSCAWSTMTTYYDQNARKLTNTLNFAGSVMVPSVSPCFKVPYTFLFLSSLALPVSSFVRPSFSPSYLCFPVRTLLSTSHYIYFMQDRGNSFVHLPLDIFHAGQGPLIHSRCRLLVTI
jgi:hypothetical protein